MSPIAWQVRLRKAADCAALLLTDARALRALTTWPRFSLASYQMVTTLEREGVVPRTVIDVGANVGQFAVATARCFEGAQVHAFEAVPAVAAQLERTVRSLPNVTVHPLALGSAAGEITMHVSADSRTSSALAFAGALREAFPAAAEAAMERVRMSTLDVEFAGETLEEPILLKLDVQGFEAEVLRGGSQLLRRVRWVVLEGSFQPLYEGETLFLDLVEMMRERGFRLVCPVGWFLSPISGGILQVDGLFAAGES